MLKVCIIKTGALGDVLRTTPILHKLKGKITWITAREALPLLEKNSHINKLVIYRDDLKLDERFDLVLNLEESVQIGQMVNRLNKGKLIGAFYNSKTKTADYTRSSSSWFDMGLISHYGKRKADRLKKINRKSYQEHLFSMFGWKYNGEEYILNYQKNTAPLNLIGLEMRVGNVWPTKAWPYFKELQKELKSRGYKTMVFRQRTFLKNYIKDVNKCSLVISGDSLAMHLALALKKRAIALFGPTPSSEIFDYGRLIKISSGLFCLSCYKKSCQKKINCMKSIEVKTVIDKINP